MKRLAFLAILLSQVAILFAQPSSKSYNEDPILLLNPDFEDFPRLGKAPRNWYNCGARNESPPDVHPVPGSQFGVAKTAYSGRTYLGMVTRENDTWESVTQRLSRPLERDNCYEFSIHLCRSPLYVSAGRSRATAGRQVNYTKPIKLRIWGSNGTCDKSELLAESILIHNAAWKEYKFNFEPKRNFSYIILEAFYETPSLFPYNGNLLLDNAQHIQPIPCPDDIIAEVIKEEQPKEDKTKTKTPNPPKPPKKVEPIVETPPVVAETTFDGKKSTELRKGDVLDIEKLYFKADSTSFTPESYEALNQLYDFLNENEKIKVEIGGHTNGNPPHAYCDALSEARAKSVANFLYERGISESRLSYKGYGKREPITTNKTVEGRRKNQRVEVKVLSIGN